MPRLKKVEPASDTGPGADLLNGPLKDKQINIFKGLAAHSPLLKAFLNFSQGVKGGALTEAEHEVIALTTAQANNCEYCLAAHTQMAKAAGLSDELALNIRQGRADDDRHQALIDFTRAVVETNGNVTDQQLEAFRNAGFNDDAIIEVVGEVAVMMFTNIYNHINQTEVDFPEPAAV